MSTTVIHKPLTDSEVDRAIADAQNTPCDVADCNGSQHEFGLAESEWSHEVVAAEFDARSVTASIWMAEGKVNGFVSYEANGDMTADEFRAAAVTYEAFPAWLRSMADRMDALSAQAWITANPNWKTTPVADLMRAGMSPLEIQSIFSELVKVGALKP